MDTRKLTEALEDLRSKREVIDRAIRSLETAVQTLGDSDEGSIGNARRSGDAKSSIDYAIDILSGVENLHIEELAKKVSEASGREVSRATLDGGISREIRERGEKSRFERPSPGVYALRRVQVTERFQ